MEKWLTSKQFREKYGVSSATLWRRKQVGSVQTKEMYGNTYYLDEETVDTHETKHSVIYHKDKRTTKEHNSTKYKWLQRLLENVYGRIDPRIRWR